MKSDRSLWIIMGIAIPVVIIITVFGVWASIEAQKEKFKEFRYQQNPNKALSDLQSGRITMLEYCGKIPQSQEESQRICNQYKN